MTCLNPKIYLASPVFYEISKNIMVSSELRQEIQDLFAELHQIADVYVSESRFPSCQEMKNLIEEQKVDFIGCHISHEITKDITSCNSVKAICTSTMGFDHIFPQPEVLITHTPSVMDKTVADFTIALILSTQRNLISLHNFLWNGYWKSGVKWDLDENMNHALDGMKVGIVGLGEIGHQVVKRLVPWETKIMYYDLSRDFEFEQKIPNLEYVDSIETIFSNCEIISLHIPLNKHTHSIIGKKLLKLMKPNALLVNTARGPIINFSELIDLLKQKEIQINLAFDVYDPEPITAEILEEFKLIQQKNPELHFTFIPHNGSSDANTRAMMSIIMLKNLLSLAKSKELSDLQDLTLIPSQRKFLDPTFDSKEDFKRFRISKWYNQKED